MSDSTVPKDKALDEHEFYKAYGKEKGKQRSVLNQKATK